VLYHLSPSASPGVLLIVRLTTLENNLGSFFKEISKNGQEIHEEMLTIPDHKGNANQNHTKIPPHFC
jgi:hypothetical protein